MNSGSDKPIAIFPFTASLPAVAPKEESHMDLSSVLNPYGTDYVQNLLERLNKDPRWRDKKVPNTKHGRRRLIPTTIICQECGATYTYMTDPRCMPREYCSQCRKTQSHRGIRKLTSKRHGRKVSRAQ